MFSFLSQSNKDKHPLPNPHPPPLPSKKGKQIHPPEKRQIAPTHSSELPFVREDFTETWNDMILRRRFLNGYPKMSRTCEVPKLLHVYEAGHLPDESSVDEVEILCRCGFFLIPSRTTKNSETGIALDRIFDISVPESSLGSSPVKRCDLTRSDTCCWRESTGPRTAVEKPC